MASHADRDVHGKARPGRLRDARAEGGIGAPALVPASPAPVGDVVLHAAVQPASVRPARAAVGAEGTRGQAVGVPGAGHGRPALERLRERGLAAIGLRAVSVGRAGAAAEGDPRETACADDPPQPGSDPARRGGRAGPVCAVCGMGSGSHDVSSRSAATRRHAVLRTPCPCGAPAKPAIVVHLFEGVAGSCRSENAEAADGAPCDAAARRP